MILFQNNRRICLYWRPSPSYPHPTSGCQFLQWIFLWDHLCWKNSQKRWAEPSQIVKLQHYLLLSSFSTKFTKNNKDKLWVEKSRLFRKDQKRNAQTIRRSLHCQKNQISRKRSRSYASIHQTANQRNNDATINELHRSKEN